MTIEARIIADSINPSGDRLTTFVCTFNRWILAEVNTHRMLSRNSASSRAIPIQKMIDRVTKHPAEPVNWGKNQKGMQAEEELSSEKQERAWEWWMDAIDSMVYHAERLLELGVHKQIVNRLLEPFIYTTAIISATDWANFFNLRAHPDAAPEFQDLAYKMLEAYRDSKPILKQPGEWHIPFGDKYVDEGLTTEQMLKIATARCARVSYLNFEGDIDHEKDYKLHDDLRSSGHFSPFEHCAQSFFRGDRYGNFRGWMQYRKMLADENQIQLNVDELLSRRPTFAA